MRPEVTNGSPGTTRNATRPQSQPPAPAPDSAIVRRAADTCQHAREHAGRGWAVFPCRPGDKRPAVDKWEQRACADLERVSRHFPQGDNIGIACGPSRLVVIDLDTHGQLPDDWRLPGITDGRDVFAQLAEWAGQTNWPVTYSVATPTGGWHLYFAAPDGSKIRNSASFLGPLVDVRGQGGYVVGAGSVLDERAYPDNPAMAALVKGGKAYEIIDDTPPAPLPAWLHRLLMPRPAPQSVAASMAANPGRRLQALADKVRAGQPGDRTGPLVWAAHRLAEMIAAGEATAADGEQLVQAAVQAGINGGEPYARYQVLHVLGVAR